MKRLEFTRSMRGVGARSHARNATEAVMVLAHVTRERHRLEQERRSLEKRMRRIEHRLTQIAGTETKLVPVIASGRQEPVADQRRPAAAPGSSGDEIMLQY